jgi:phosphoribosyl 1,2-cyclic phosphodiesterase
LVRIRLRGVRGSVPWSVPDAVVHGCNTPCIEVFDERSGHVLVLDAGSGIVGVHPARIAESHPASAVSLVLTHYHWDHVVGLPFFTPLYEPGRELTIYTPGTQSHDPAWLATIFRPSFFAVPYDDLPNRPKVQMVEAGSFSVPGFDLTALALNHPGGAFAYRIKGADGDLVYATDHEFGDPSYDEPLAAFARGASAILLDAHFTPEERARHRGWGHSDWRQCAEFAATNAIGKLYLFHHKPGRSDSALDRIRDDPRRGVAATDTAKEEDTVVI